MKFIKLTLKVMGLILGIKILLSLTNLISYFILNNHSNLFSYNELIIPMLLIVISIILIITPKWLLWIFKDIYDIDSINIEPAILLRIIVIVFGIFLIITNGINLLSYIIKYSIVFNGNNEISRNNIINEGIQIINYLVSIICGLLLVKFENKFSLLLINNRKN